VTSLASFSGVFQIVVGVLLSLGGLGVLLMGVMAMMARRWRGGAVGCAVGLGLLFLGFWLVGVVG
jgi:hypothetical protein